MTQTNRRKVSAMALAKDVRGFAVDIRLKDVMRLMPEWSYPQAERFLTARQAEIAERMLRTGLQAIVELARAEVPDGN